MRLFILFFFFISFFSVYGQPENLSSGRLYVAPKKEAPLQPKSPEKSYSPVVDSWLKNYQKPLSFSSEEKGVDFTGQYKKQYAQREFQLPESVRGDTKENEYDLSSLKGDKSYGNYSSNANAVGIFCRDYANVDGDLVDVYLNDELFISNVYLTGNFQQLHIPLKIGFNKIEIKAVNQGLYGPNTAHFQVIDENNNVLINETWALLTGYKARFVIVKDK
ncbi:hypothetical protein [uncultured Capnocytophaga sp.]|jgi:putative secreted protein|uniref:hypothetical protein n=1 Tax=uncultured Capnocytophaga sp. TaxID=159273 RepID=UPI00288B805C|nr:hypothetical protein [uncultured Capnocytophaga sp.]